MEPLIELGGRWRIFLSHAHSDSDDARWLEHELRGRVGVQTRRRIELFRTSEPQYTFTPSRRSDGDVRAMVRRYQEELRAYLLEHMAQSAACLLLVTSGSIDREWINWEIEEATRLADEHKILFVPCLLRVETSVLLDMKQAWKAKREMKQSGVSLWERVRDVPPEAAEAHLENAVLLHEDGGLDRLADKLARALAAWPNT